MELRYDIVATGEQNVRRALRGVEAEIVASGRRATAVAARAPGGASASKKAEREATNATRKAEREAIAAQRRIAKAEESATRSSERARLAAEKRVWAEKEARAKRFAQIEIQENAKAQRKVEAGRRQWSNTAQSMGRGVGTSVRSATGKIVGLGGTAIAALGGLGAADAVSQEIGIGHRIRQVTANARQAGTVGADPGAVRKQVRDTALSTGASESGLVGAVETYTARTGDLATATANLRTFATVAMATGASVEDVAATAADLAQKFNITKPQEMADAFAVLAFQGKRGAFELKAMATTFPELAAAAQRMGMAGVGGMKTLGGLAQLAQSSTGGSGESASTNVQAMLTQLTVKADDLKSGEALGGKKVNVFEGGNAENSMRDVRQVLADIISTSHGNMSQLTKLFDVRGVRAASPLITAYRSASDAAGGGSKGEAAGRAAVLKALSDASDAVVSFSEVEKDAADVAKSDAVKIEKINTRLREAFSSSLLPAIERAMPEFERMIPQIASVTEALAGMASYFVSNPLSGIGAIITAQVAADIGQAAIGQGVKAALSTSFGQMGALGIGTLMATVEVMNLLTASAHMDANTRLNALDENGRQIREQAKAEMMTGEVTPETKKRLEALRGREDRRVWGKEFKDPLEGVGVVGRFGSWVTGGPSPFNADTATSTMDAGRVKTNLESRAETDKLLAEVAAQHKAAAEALKQSAKDISAAAKSSTAPERSKPIVAR